MPGSFIASILALCRAVSLRGDRFVLVCTDVPGATWHASLAAAGGTFVAVTSASEAIRAARAQRPDIVHTHFSGYDLPMLRAFAIEETRLYWHVHFTAVRARGIARVRQLVKYRGLASLVTQIVTVSHAARASLIGCGASEDRVCAIQNGIDTSHFRPPAKDERIAARRSFGMADRERVVFFYGRDTRLKGSDVLWEALDKVGPITVLLVGAPAAARAEFARRARVVAIDRLEDTRGAYWAADILALPSRTESWGFVLAEALSCGVPAAAANLPALREAADGDAAAVRYFACGDAAGLAEILADRDFGPADASAASYRARFSLQKWVDAVLKMYASTNP